MIFGGAGSQPVKKRKKLTSNSVSEDEESANAMFQKMCIRNNKSKHSNDSSDDESDVYEHCHALPIERPTKRSRKSKRCSEVIVRLPGTNAILRALLDSGTSSSIILKTHVDSKVHGISSYKAPPTKWKTMGGVYTTCRRAQVAMQLPEFSLRKRISWTFHVDETLDPAVAQYDMIIGDDLLQELGLVLDYSTDPPMVKWDQVSVPMKEKGTLNDKEVLLQSYALTLDLSSRSLKEARSSWLWVVHLFQN